VEVVAVLLLLVVLADLQVVVMVEQDCNGL
jgi:hypothetical protein